MNEAPNEWTIHQLTEELVATYKTCSKASYLGQHPLPSREAVAEFISDLFELLFPGFGKRQNLHLSNVTFHVGDLLDGLVEKVTKQIARAIRHHSGGVLPKGDVDQVAREKAYAFLAKLPQIRQILETDVDAAIKGDPAATGAAEIVFCYPGFEAVTVYRLAHELLELGVPLIPRMMCEIVHGKTGIDLHPGAKIGSNFFIDHGTGVVVGATCVIGDQVKLYQGVTLGALSFPRDADGNLIRNRKRHPTLDDDVVVYANATILGGETVVGRHSVIGSNVWLTRSVPPYTSVVIQDPSLKIRTKGQDPFVGDFQI